MNKTFRLKICGLIRELPLVYIGDDFAFASFMAMGDTELIERTAEALVNHHDFPAFDVDVLICPDTKAAPLAHAMARRLKVNYVVARKGVKPYMVDQVIERIEAEGDEEELVLVLDGIDAKQIEGRNVCLVDDVVSTGGSLKVLENIASGLRCKVVGKAAILLEESGYQGDDLIYLEKLPLFKE